MHSTSYDTTYLTKLINDGHVDILMISDSL